MAPKSLTQKIVATTTKFNVESAPKTSILTDAFVTAAGPKRAEPMANTSEQKKIYLLSHADRKLLSTGPRVKILDAKDMFVMDMSLALFRATSTKKNQLLTPNNSVIKLPAGLDTQMVKHLVKHLSDITTWKKKYTGDIRSYESTYEDMQLCSAAEALGMETYTQHIFNWYWARVRAGILPGYGDIEAFSAVETPLGAKLFKKFVQSLAELDSKGKIPDPEDFQAYLTTNDRLRSALAEAKSKLQRHQDWLERKAKREEAAKLQKIAVDDERVKGLKKIADEKAAKEKTKWDMAKKKEAALRTTVLEKRAAGYRKWTGEEAAYYERLFSKKVPV